MIAVLHTAGQLKPRSRLASRSDCVMHAMTQPRLHAAGEAAMQGLLLMALHTGIHSEELPAIGICAVHHLDARLAVAGAEGGQMEGEQLQPVWYLCSYAPRRLVIIFLLARTCMHPVPEVYKHGAEHMMAASMYVCS